MKARKWLGALTVITVVFIAAFAVGTTLGNPETARPVIKQHTLQRASYGSTELVPFHQKINLLPSRALPEGTTAASLTYGADTLSCDLWNGFAGIDHIVAVKNEGDAKGYVRTWFAVEQGELSEEEFLSVIEFNRNETDWSWSIAESSVEIDGARYCIFLAEYTVNGGALEPGELTSPSMLQILLKPTVTENELLLLDENADQLVTIHVKTQAVSDSAAWSAAFGDTHPWA